MLGSYVENIYTVTVKWFLNLLNSVFDFLTNYIFSNPLFFSLAIFFVLAIIAFVVRWLYYAIIVH